MVHRLLNKSRVKTTENSLRSEAKVADAGTKTPESGSKRRVLRVWVVDDDAVLSEVFARLSTKQHGIRCRRQFPSAEGVLAALAEERPPDVILLDVNLGKQSGMAAIGPIKQLAPSVNVLMLTMFSNSDHELEAFEAGASGFLLKSYEVGEIAGLIHEARCNPGAPGLFPNLALYKELGWPFGQIDARGSNRAFTLVNLVRHLWGIPRRQTQTP